MQRNDGDLVIAVRALRMAYGAFEAVRGLDLTVHRGEVVAVLGPNGAGKTTTMEILEGFRQRTGGTVTVLGEDPATAGAAWRARLGVVLQESEPEPELTVRECLALYAGYYPRPRPPAAPAGRSSPGYASWAKRSCSPPTTWKRRRRWPTASRWSPPAGWWPKARRAPSAGGMPRPR